MKFYKSYSYYSSNLIKIISENLNAIYSYYDVLFFKNGKEYNDKNAAYISYINKQFILNNIVYGTENDFIKKSWRRFVKMQVFL